LNATRTVGTMSRMRRVDLSDESHHEIERIADERGVSFDEVVNELIKEGLAQRKKKSSTRTQKRSRIPAILLKPGPRVKVPLSETIIRDRGPR
jgi:hypothetical protein